MIARRLAAFHAWRIDRHAERQEAREYRAHDALAGWPLRHCKQLELRDALAADINDNRTEVAQ